MQGGEEEDEGGWYSGGEKSLAEREFVLPSRNVTLRIYQEQAESSAELWARGQGSVVWEASSAALSWLDSTYGSTGELKGRTAVECALVHGTMLAARSTQIH